jgi:O-succinylbenzoic acid--CoA ligase
VVFTSGSEGTHKGVVLTGANVAASVTGSRDRLGNGPDDAWLGVLPLFHVGGLSILWRQAEQAAPVVLEAEFDPARVAGLLATTRFASLVPTMLRRVLDAGGVSGSSTVLVGGGPADVSLLRRAIDAGIPALQTYGMTETASQVTTVAPGDEEADLGTAGRPIHGAEVRIADGRIELRGPMLSPGYLGEDPRPEGSWFTTGDLGSVDGQGRLTVLGRADAVIVTGGENVHPAVVERVLRNHPGVVDARVFGAPDDQWGRRVVAEVVLEGITATQLREWAAAHLTPAQIPKEWRPVERVQTKLE